MLKIASLLLASALPASALPVCLVPLGFAPAAKPSKCHPNAMEPSLRREVRELSAAEWKRYTDALWVYKKGTRLCTDSFLPTYDAAVAFHGLSADNETYDQAHKGPKFGSFHGMHLAEVERCLRQIDPELEGIPYWDWTIDPMGVFTPQLFGSPGTAENNFSVVDGPFKDWPIPMLNSPTLANLPFSLDLFKGNAPCKGNPETRLQFRTSFPCARNLTDESLLKGPPSQANVNPNGPTTLCRNPGAEHAPSISTAAMDSDCQKRGTYHDFICCVFYYPGVTHTFDPRGLCEAENPAHPWPNPFSGSWYLSQQERTDMSYTNYLGNKVNVTDGEQIMGVEEGPLHGSVHGWAGGGSTVFACELSDASFSPGDPLFFSLHNNVERFRASWLKNTGHLIATEEDPCGRYTSAPTPIPPGHGLHDKYYPMAFQFNKEGDAPYDTCKGFSGKTPSVKECYSYLAVYDKYVEMPSRDEL